MARGSRDVGAYRAAMDLYAGELLPEDRYEVWTEDRREELKSTHLSLLLELAALYEERGEYGAAAEALQKVLASECMLLLLPDGGMAPPASQRRGR